MIIAFVFPLYIYIYILHYHFLTRAFLNMTSSYEKLYYTPALPTSYGGVQRLMQGIDGASRPRIESFLKGEDAYTLHKPVRRRFKSAKTVAYGVDHIWQIDLTDMRKYASYNDGVRFLLFIIDVFSRYLWVVPLKDKKASTVSNAFFNLMREEERVPALIHTDRGTEFSSLLFQELLKHMGVGYYNTFSPNKAAMVERVQRTIKERMHRYFTSQNSYRYIHVLKDFVSSYNRSFHRVIGTTPLRIVREKSEPPTKDVGKNLKAKYKVGDYVRVSRIGEVFKKGYEEGWSREVFKIVKVKRIFNTPLYYLEDLNEEKILGGFYAEELQSIHFFPRTHRYSIEKIIRSEGKGKNKRYLVKWSGYPKSFNSYIKASEVERV